VDGLTIGQFVEHTGVPEGTLRMWERRYGFPSPERLPSGHRRYSEDEVALVRRLASERSAGLSLTAAIERVKESVASPPPSVYASLRRRRPDLEPRPLRKPILLALTRAIEDESLSRADRPLLFASFQSERFYRQEQARWRELARGAELAVTFADFDRLRKPRHGPAEVPIERNHPMAREWTVVCCAEDHAVCLAAWEPPPTRPRSDQDRVFETIWSVEPQVVWDAARVSAGIAAVKHAGLIDPVRSRLEIDPGRPAEDQLRLAAAITSRTLSYLS
jgi:MerR family transcriptional regulator, light-induced transcriptional regulator